MPDRTDELISALGTSTLTWSDGFALALSERLNRMVVFGVPAAESTAVDAAHADPDAYLQTNFVLPELCKEECLLALPGVLAPSIYALLTDSPLSKEPEPLGDEEMTKISEAMAGAIQGLAQALTNLRGVEITADVHQTTIGQLTLPTAFATEDSALVLSLPFTAQEDIDSTLRIYLTPKAAAALSGLPEEEEGAAVEGGVSNSPFDFLGMTDESFGMPLEEPQSALGLDDSESRGIDLIMDIPLNVTVELGRMRMLIRDVLSLNTGSIVELEKVAGEPVDLLVNGCLVAKGEVVVIDDNFGIRVTEIVGHAERLATLAKR